MRHLKSFAIAMAIMISSSTFANSETTFVDDKTSIPYEMEKLLKDNSLILEDDLFGKVIFTVSAEKDIIIHSVISKEAFVREYLEDKLKDKNLSSNEWVIGQTYILPVKLKCIK